MRADVTATEVSVLGNEEVAPEHYVIRLAAPEIASTARPGQFAMLRVPGSYDPLLPRAFSFYRVDPETGVVEFLYRVVGKGTRLLAAQRPGARLHLWGPLGRGFEPPHGPSLLVGGGVGVPPLVFLAEYTARENRSATSQPLTDDASPITHSLSACFGFATAAWVVGEEPLRAAGVPLRIATDDGTRGHRGFVTDLLRDALEDTISVYACGPHAMLAAVARICETAGVVTQLALEAPMACGVGACIGCTVPRRGGGYARVCTEGPVFRAEEIAWNKE